MAKVLCVLYDDPIDGYGQRPTRGGQDVAGVDPGPLV
jgi:hypothetical protein